MPRKRINKSRQYHLFDARVGDLDAYIIHIYATGRNVVVMARCAESAVVSIQTWLRSTGIDSRVYLIDSYSRLDVLSSAMLLHQSELCLNDPKLPL